MQTIILNNLIKNYEAETLEKALIYHYISKNKIEIKDSDILKEYIEGYKPSLSLNSDFEKFNISSIKELEKILGLIIPAKDRELNGAIFTPSFIVDFIIEKLNPKENDKNIDPSCGCGAFLIGLLDYYGKKHSKSIAETIRENIFGVDILEYNVLRTKILLALYGLQNGEIIKESDFNIICGDSLKFDWKNLFRNNPSGKFNNVLGNPPYVKFQDLSDEMRSGLIENWTSIKKGNFNLYFAFFELGYNLLTSDGKLGYITPNNYFTSLAGESLRKYFQEKKCITEIIDFNHKKVFNVLTYTAITFIDKNVNNFILYDRIKENQNPEEFLSSLKQSKNEVGKLNTKKWRLLKSSERDNIKRIETIGIPIKELFEVRSGIATLKDKIYFIDGKNRINDYYIKEYKGYKYLIEAEITRSIYKISDFKCQEDCDDNTRRIIFPYYFTSNGLVQCITEEDLKEKFPKCYSYLLAVKNELLLRDKGKCRVEVWYAYGRSQGLSKIGKKIITPTFSKHPRFLVIDDETAFFTNGYGIYFKNNNQSDNDLFDTKNSIANEENIKLVQKILNSSIMDYYIRKTSVGIDGGYYCYQKNFIEMFTIPQFEKEEIKLLKKLNNKKEIDEFLIDKYKVKF